MNLLDDLFNHPRVELALILTVPCSILAAALVALAVAVPLAGVAAITLVLVIAAVLRLEP